MFISVRRQLDDEPDYRPLLKQIQSSGESHIILDVGLEKIISLLRQASEVKMMEEYQSYIITSLDAHTLDFEELKYMRANITTMRLIDPTSFEVMNGEIVQGDVTCSKAESFLIKIVFEDFSSGSGSS